MWYRTGALVAAATLAATSVASAQASDPRATLTAAANALGMVRGLERSLTVVNMFEFTANGTMADASGAPTSPFNSARSWQYPPASSVVPRYLVPRTKDARAHRKGSRIAP